MDIKKSFQFSLLILLFISSFLFYYKYFSDDTKKIKSEESETLLKLKKNDSKTNQDDANKNIIENLKYVSEDLAGNTYTVTAQSATLEEDELNELQLFKVNAEITKENQETIYISSKTCFTRVIY